MIGAVAVLTTGLCAAASEPAAFSLVFFHDRRAELDPCG